MGRALVAQLPNFSIGKNESYEDIVRRWREIHADPKSIRIAKQMAEVALKRLGNPVAEPKFTEREYLEVEVQRGLIDRRPGEDDE